MAEQIEMAVVRAHRPGWVWDGLRRLLHEVIENLGPVEVAGITGAHVDHIRKALEPSSDRKGKASRRFAVSWLVAILQMDASQRVIQALCEICGGDFVPRERRTLEQENEQLRDALASFGPKGHEEMQRRGIK